MQCYKPFEPKRKKPANLYLHFACISFVSNEFRRINELTKKKKKNINLNKLSPYTSQKTFACSS